MRGGLWEFSTDLTTLHPSTRCRHLWGISGVSPACAFSLRLAAGAPARLWRAPGNRWNDPFSTKVGKD